MNEPKAGRQISAMPKQNPSPRVRWKKVCAIRQQLLQGEYDLDRRLNATIDRALQELTLSNEKSQVN